jgi:hypothetical protein
MGRRGGFSWWGHTHSPHSPMVETCGYRRPTSMAYWNTEVVRATTLISSSTLLVFSFYFSNSEINSAGFEFVQASCPYLQDLQAHFAFSRGLGRAKIEKNIVELLTTLLCQPCWCYNCANTSRI